MSGKTVEATKQQAWKPDASGFGLRKENGEWRPPEPCTYAPLFAWPPQPKRLFKWLFGFPGYLWPYNLIHILLAAATWLWLQPNVESCVTLRPGWISLMLLRNVLLMWIVYGGHHLVLYSLKLHGTERKYFPKWQAKTKRYLFNNQVYDNVFRSCVIGVPVWTAYEAFYMWALANGKMPTLAWSQNPVWFCAAFLIIPLWRELHFYLIHRLIHWKPLFKHVHRIHHLNANCGPWSGMAMHPVETILYLSVVAIHFVVPMHPLHFFFNSQLTAITPAYGHHGFEGPLFDGKFQTGSYFHYLHHRYVCCNFGETTVPLDRWFGRFYDGTGEFKA